MGGRSGGAGAWSDASAGWRITGPGPDGLPASTGGADEIATGCEAQQAQW
jgi:hypothetical protein